MKVIGSSTVPAVSSSARWPKRSASSPNRGVANTAAAKTPEFTSPACCPREALHVLQVLDRKGLAEREEDGRIQAVQCQDVPVGAVEGPDAGPVHALDRPRRCM